MGVAALARRVIFHLRRLTSGDAADVKSLQSHCGAATLESTFGKCRKPEFEHEQLPSSETHHTFKIDGKDLAAGQWH